MRRINKSIHIKVHLENPMDGGAWGAAVHGVAKSRTWLSDFTFTFHFSCIGEGNGTPLQCSCLKNPRDGGAWRAAVCGVAQSRTWLKWLISSSRLVIAFLLRSKRLLISWLQSPSAVILGPKKVSDCFHLFPIDLPWSDGTRCHDLRFLNVEL